MGITTDFVTRRRFLWLGAVATGSLALGGCEAEPAAPAPSSTAFDDPAGTASSGDSAGAGDGAPDSVAAVDEAAAARLGAMTLEQKVAQLFIVAPEALVQDVSQVTQAGDATHAGLTAWPVGGIAYFAQNLIDPDQATAMLANVKGFYSEDGSVPPFLGVDEEGGTVVRVAGNEAFAAPNVGDASALGAAADEAAAKAAAEQIADYLKPLGFNLDFAPVCDVAALGGGTAMDERSFGSDPALVASLATAEIEGFLGKGMLCCAKHFPGIGSAVGDSHDDAITVEKTAEELEAVDLAPFKAAIEAGVPMIMVGHLDLPNVTGDYTPASLSPVVVQGILRDQLGYTGIVVTDSLSMGAIANYRTAAEAAVAALAAGCDIPLMPEDFPEAYQGVLDAVAAGTLTEERIDESVLRILKAKQQYLGGL